MTTAAAMHASAWRCAHCGMTHFVKAEALGGQVVERMAKVTDAQHGADADAETS